MITVGFRCPAVRKPPWSWVGSAAAAQAGPARPWPPGFSAVSARLP